VLAALLLPACTDDRGLIDRTLDARSRALADKDLDAYFGLFSPDYVWAQPMREYRNIMRLRFKNYLSIEYQAYSRQVDLRGDLARVIQAYRFTLTDRYHQTQTLTGTDHFMMKRHGFWPFTRWLFYQGLDATAKPKAAPAPESPTPTAPPNPGGGA
jgi:hypothetical protein